MCPAWKMREKHCTADWNLLHDTASAVTAAAAAASQFNWFEEEERGGGWREKFVPWSTPPAVSEAPKGLERIKKESDSSRFSFPIIEIRTSPTNRSSSSPPPPPAAAATKDQYHALSLSLYVSAVIKKIPGNSNFSFSFPCEKESAPERIVCGIQHAGRARLRHSGISLSEHRKTFFFSLLLLIIWCSLKGKSCPSACWWSNYKAARWAAATHPDDDDNGLGRVYRVCLSVCCFVGNNDDDDVRV